MEKIVGKEKSLYDLLSEKKYLVHYYQREYRWGKQQIEELIDDLTGEFDEHYAVGDDSKAVATYGYYYLGSIVLSMNEADRAIIDGQQRLTSITLLLIYLNNLQRDHTDPVSIERLIYSDEFGPKSFNIDVKERRECLEALYKDGQYFEENPKESVRTMMERYTDIQDIFPEHLKGDALPLFIRWLIRRVYLVEITALAEQDAHRVFVTMNDRGLSLTSTEMLKGYLLSKIDDDTTRNNANDLWKATMLQLKQQDPDSKEGDAELMKTWLRAQYADTIREGSKDSENRDWDIIGTTFHKWVRENASRLNLNRSADYERFVLQEMKHYAAVFQKLKGWSMKYAAEQPYVYFNANRNFTLQGQVIMAAIAPYDPPDMVQHKVRLVSCYLDQWITLRIVNGKAVDYSTVKSAMFILTKEVRRKSVEEIRALLQSKLAQLAIDGMNWDAFGTFYLYSFTKRHILHMLARMGDHLSVAVEGISRFAEWVDRDMKHPYDIEHCLPNHFSMHDGLFIDPEEFDIHRNRLGALLLLPRDKNRSLQDIPYPEKVEHYATENILAQTLSPVCYKNNPHFVDLVAKTGLGLKPYSMMGKEEIKERQQSYKQLAQLIWDPKLLETI